MSKIKLAVRPDEDPWTADERKSITAELNADVIRLGEQLDTSTRDLQDLLRDGVAGAGSDEADVGASSVERDSEMTLQANQRELLLQTEKALERLELGTYGTCEACGEAIGKMRLMAFPRATLCMTCKKREERR